MPHDARSVRLWSYRIRSIRANYSDTSNSRWPAVRTYFRLTTRRRISLPTMTYTGESLTSTAHKFVLPEHEDFLNLTITKGLRTAQGGAQTRNAIEQKLRILSVASMFQIDSIQTTVARNKNGEPEQLIVLTTTADISTRELSKTLQIRLLPKRKLSGIEKAAEVETEGDLDQSSEESAASNDETDSDENSVGSQVKETELWKSATDVPDDVLDAAHRIAFTPMESGKPLDRQHAFRVRVESEGELYVRVNKGVQVFGGFPLSEDYNAVVAVPALPSEVQIEGQGGLLALSGERKLSIRSRGLGAIEYEIARVATTTSTIWSAKPKGNSSIRISAIPISSTRKTFPV